MKSLAILAVALLAPLSALATDATPPSPAMQWQADPKTVFEAHDVALADFQWIARPVVVFADTPADPRFQQQMALLEARAEELAERDVVILTDTDPTALSDARQHLRPRGFMLALLAKDGTVALRKPFPWDVRELTRAIDKMPLREQEIRDRHAAPD